MKLYTNRGKFYIQIRDLDHKEGWVQKNWCFQVVVLEKTPESPLNSEELQQVNPKGNQFWKFIGRTDAEAEAPILSPPDAKNQLTGRDLDAGKDWRQEEKGVTEDEMAEWHHWFHGREFEQTPGDGKGQGSLACCGSWGCKEWGMTWWLNNNHICKLVFDKFHLKGKTWTGVRCF